MMNDKFSVLILMVMGFCGLMIVMIMMMLLWMERYGIVTVIGMVLVI